jgi:hypothetical protein
MNVPWLSCFQVADVFDTAPQFTKSLYAAGINTGDRVDETVTTFSVSTQLQWKHRHCSPASYRYHSAIDIEATCAYDCGLTSTLSRRIHDQKP